MLEYSLRHSKHYQLSNVVSAASDDDDTDLNVDDTVLAIAAIKKVDVSACPA